MNLEVILYPFVKNEDENFLLRPSNFGPEGGLSIMMAGQLTPPLTYPPPEIRV